MFAIKEQLNWGDKEVQELGDNAPKLSFIIKLMVKYFVSLKQSFAKGPDIWARHYDVGELVVKKVDIKGRKVVAQLRDFPVNPIFCVYIKGYFRRFIQFSISCAVKVKETKCMSKGDLFHEFKFWW